MKRVRPDLLACQLQPPCNPRIALQAHSFSKIASARHTRPLSSLASSPSSSRSSCQPQACNHSGSRRWIGTSPRSSRLAVEQNLPIVPPPSASSRRSNTSGSLARLSALHARLQLPPEFALSTLARCLVHYTADPNSARNNASLAILGQDLLAYYTSEHLIVNYPRLPVPIIFAAQYAYSGPATLAAIRAEWGVELAAAPGPEVNKAFMQFQRVQPGNALAPDGFSQVKDLAGSRRTDRSRVDRANYMRRGMSGRIAVDDEFGEVWAERGPYPGALISQSRQNTGRPSLQEEPSSRFAANADDPGVTAEVASATFVRALVGALHLHCGEDAVKKFHKDHILSRHFELHKLFDFKQPTFDLSRLCAREDFEAPIARLLSETGRMSRTPVFVVGVFSGEDKLGEGAGASLNEARVRAAAAALRAWYLYSPPVDRIMAPSEAREGSRTWIPQMIDPGEIVA